MAVSIRASAIATVMGVESSRLASTATVMPLPGRWASVLPNPWAEPRVAHTGRDEIRFM